MPLLVDLSCFAERRAEDEICICGMPHNEREKCQRKRHQCLVYQVEENGKWTLIQIVKNLVNPSFLCMDKNGEYLYTIHGDKSEISSFSVDKATGQLI